MVFRDKLKQYSKGLKVRFKKSSYGELWQDESYVKDNGEYESMIKSRPLMIEFIKKYIEKINPETTLEIGCGTGYFPIKHKNLFQKYTAMDIGKPAIDFCRKNSEFEFLEGDFIKTDLNRKFDLVFTQSVIDHVYDPNEFLKQIVKHTKKHALICAYRGYFPEYEDHKMEYFNRGGFYHNELSVKKIKETLLNYGLTNNQFSIHKQANGRGRKNEIRNFDTVVEIEL